MPTHRQFSDDSWLPAGRNCSVNRAAADSCAGLGPARPDRALGVRVSKIALPLPPPTDLDNTALGAHTGDLSVRGVV